MSFENKGALAGERYRVIVTTDIGGSDYDDYQSMAHYLLYSDLFDTEGLISSAWGRGTVWDIYQVLDCYERDYPNLLKYSDRYPTPDTLRKMTKQGAIKTAPYRGYTLPTEASEWIIKCARKEDDRPLYVLTWGLLEDLAQALHDAPDITPKLRVHYIGGPNKKWGPNAYEYIRRNFPDLWMIENNSSYRGWFNGGIQSAPWGNEAFMEIFAKGHGALGDFLYSHPGHAIRMGDTPTVAWLLYGNPAVPENGGWGGQYDRVGDIMRVTYHGSTSLKDTVEVFGTLELILRGPEYDGCGDEPAFMLETKEQLFPGFYCGNGEYRIRFVPKEVSEWQYVLHSDIKELNGQTGAFTSVPENPATRTPQSGNLTSWWSDLLAPEFADGPYKGTKTINRFRKDFLEDFAKRLERCCDTR
ncbi:MAG: DUF1593 domain-containing protein [Lachnospiraceae bacterium]|nr:DUF1593 domain-containing protein [Lachnospiraceae bacterium]